MSADLSYKNRFKFEFINPNYKNIEINVQQINLPGLTLGTMTQPTPMRKIFMPGNDFTFEDLTMTILLDEELKTWKSIFQWLKELQSTTHIEFARKTTDAVLHVLNNKHKSILEVTFEAIFPTNLGQIQFDVTDEGFESLTSSATFKINDIKI